MTDEGAHRSARERVSGVITAEGFGWADSAP
jgi:hypothetical protein